jgi:4-diphosphocytidyl-2-C-methyl-D-erythritol kinase
MAGLVPAIHVFNAAGEPKNMDAPREAGYDVCRMPKSLDQKPLDDTLTEFAPAKVNLTLRVLGRRADGYHDIESLVAFASVGDDLVFTPADALDLTVQGPSAAAAGPLGDNLVTKAARALASRVEGLKLGHFVLTKRLPVAAGLGGGSADAAAALRLLARANGLSLDDPRLMAAARTTGADVPVCLDPKARLMRGIGDILSAPLDLPQLHAVLVNPGVALATKDVFAALAAPRLRQGATPAAPDLDDVAALITTGTNDLERPAISLRPIIADVLAALRNAEGCRLARMSGSGATCFGLFVSPQAAEDAARRLHAGSPHWWVQATAIR